MEELEWSLYFLDREEKRQRSYLERVIGVTWDRKTVNAMFGKGKDTAPRSVFQNEVFWPLALAMRPEMGKDLQAVLGGKSQVNEEVPDDAGNLGNLSKESFVEFMNKALRK